MESFFKTSGTKVIKQSIHKDKDNNSMHEEKKKKQTPKRMNNKKRNEDEIDRLIELYKKVASFLSYDIHEPTLYKFITTLLEYLKENQIKRIIYNWKFLKDDEWNPINILKDPFSFITFENQMITFNKAEKMRVDMDISVDIKTHTRAWIIYYFANEGFYIEHWKVEKTYIESFQSIYGNKVTCNTLRPLLKEYYRRDPKTNSNIKYYTTEYLMNLEKSLGDDILDLYYEDDEPEIDESKIIHFIEEVEKKRNIVFTEQQKKCIVDGMKHKLHIINGYPGTGKSTIMDVIIEYMVKMKNYDPNHIFNLAPTGLAMKNLMIKCGSNINKQNGMTLHKFILFMYNIENSSDLKSEYPGCYSKIFKKDGVLIKKYYYTPYHINIDESSMIDIFMFKKIIKICKKYKCSLTLIGDYHQLPPCGLGTPFENIIKSGYFKLNNLTVIKRQDGCIGNNIKLMNEESITEENFDNKSMVFIKTSDFSDKNINSLIEKNVHGSKAIILSQRSNHINKYGWDTVNFGLQKLWNPMGDQILSWHTNKLCVGDLVIRTENEYDENDIRVNGDVGYITNYDGNKVVISYLDNTDETVSVKKLYDIFELFYASTVHKMQGGERDNIVIIIHPKHEFMWSRSQDKKKLLYTAISRAKKKCVIIGDYNLFLKAQEPIEEYKKPISLFMKEFNEYE